MKYSGNGGEYLALTELTEDNKNILFDNFESSLSLLWNTDDYLRIEIDNETHILEKDQIIFLTQLHKIDDIALTSARLLRFNRTFYCVVEHDNDVSCKGVLFFGAATIPRISIAEEEFEKFDMLWKMFRLEIATKDTLQIDMLQTMLKRVLIECARILKKSTNYELLETSQSDVVREFYYLVECNFIEHHDVAFYADKLNKSPKTLSNLFSIVSNKTPLQIIHDRIMLHAKRQIQYSDKSIKEIAYDLGYEDIQTFSRFFKNKEGISPIEHREKLKIKS
ncbi:AraC family transcriptional regulator [Flavobacterium sp. UBA7682]|uniref:AraC family transcriptional regulator n=1 Tax=Flavobacterium sp. UBA7682 TaxID=1946560 RepID=UPI0025B9D47C|nr:helix-turn-helix domain-containing protein [Flavobacterium sp. UBA7682]